MTIDNSFSWLAIHCEAAHKILDYRGRTGELVEIIQRMHVAGLRAMPIDDKDAEGNRFPLTEIDPFTFLANFNRGVTDANRRALWEFLKREWELESAVPDDFDGLPLANLQNSWMIPYLAQRDPQEVPVLWEFFGHILDADLETLDLALMDRCLGFRGVGLAFLTMGMFWVKPGTWVAADSKNVAFAKSKGATEKPRDAGDYREWAGRVIAEAGGEVLRFSRDAHLWALEQAAADRGPAEVELGKPFDDLFDNMEQANEVLEVFRESLLILQDGQTERTNGITVTARTYGSRILIRVNAGQWAVMNFDSEGLWLALTPLAFAREYSGRLDMEGFKKQIDGVEYELLDKLSADEFFSESVQAAFREALRAAGEAFAFGNPMPRAEAHRPDLYDAIMFPALRAEILAAGLAEPSKPTAPVRPLWVIAPGENGTLWKSWREKGIAAIGWNETGDLTDLEDIEAFREAVASTLPDVGASKVGHMLHAFAAEMKPGDVVVAKQGVSAALGWGVVTGGYRYDKGASPFSHLRAIEWRESRRIALPKDLRLAMKTLTGYREESPQRNFLEEQYSFLNAPESVVEAVTEYTRADALKDLFVDPAALDRMMSLLRRKKNLILQGAPGTGKTYIADRLAYLLMGVVDENRAPMVQFHQSTSYEDFIQGFRPNDDGRFILRNGVFFDFCRAAAADPEQKYVFIIDEINRGNLSKIFGELMLLIEPDKRGAEHSIRLVYGDSDSDPFYVPANVYLIGTMNTADRSLSLVDYALRRRFAFFEMEPGFASPGFAEVLQRNGVSPGMVSRVRSVMGTLNGRIENDRASLGSGYRIGHSFFVPGRKITAEKEWFREVVEYEILPLVEEYWADDSKALTEGRGILGL